MEAKRMRKSNSSDEKLELKLYQLELLSKAYDDNYINR